MDEGVAIEKYCKGCQFCKQCDNYSRNCVALERLMEIEK